MVPLVDPLVDLLAVGLVVGLPLGPVLLNRLLWKANLLRTFLFLELIIMCRLLLSLFTRTPLETVLLTLCRTMWCSG